MVPDIKKYFEHGYGSKDFRPQLAQPQSATVQTVLAYTISVGDSLKNCRAK
jgi:hypothetical protein